MREDKESCHGCVGADEEAELRRGFRALGYAGERRKEVDGSHVPRA